MCICDAASNTILRKLTIESHYGHIQALSVSPDKSRLLLADGQGDVSIWDVSDFLQDHTHSTVEDPTAQKRLDDSRAHPFLVKFNIRTPNPLGLLLFDRIAFSTDNRAILTYEKYTPIPSLEHWPLSAQREDTSQSKQGAPVLSSAFPNYYVEYDGWIWRVDAGGERRRVRWLPPGYRYIPSSIDVHSSGDWNIHGHRIALVTRDGRLVLVDASDS